MNEDNHSDASLDQNEEGSHEQNTDGSHEQNCGLHTMHQSSQHNYAINLHSHTVKNLSCSSLKEADHDDSKSNDSSHLMDKAVEVFHPSQSQISIEDQGLRSVYAKHVKIAIRSKAKEKRSDSKKIAHHETHQFKSPSTLKSALLNHHTSLKQSRNQFNINLIPNCFYSAAKDTPKENREQMAKSLISTIDFKSPQQSQGRNNIALLKNTDEHSDMHPGALSIRGGLDDHMAVNRLIQLAEDQQSKTTNQQAVPMTSRDVSHCGEKTHEINNRYTVVHSPTISIKGQQSQVLLNLEDRSSIRMIFTRDAHSGRNNLELQLDNVESHSNQHAAGNVSHGSKEPGGSSQQSEFKEPQQTSNNHSSSHQQDHHMSQRHGQLAQTWMHGQQHQLRIYYFKNAATLLQSASRAPLHWQPCSRSNLQHARRLQDFNDELVLGDLTVESE